MEFEDIGYCGGGGPFLSLFHECESSQEKVELLEDTFELIEEAEHRGDLFEETDVKPGYKRDLEGPTSQLERRMPSSYRMKY